MTKKLLGVLVAAVLPLAMLMPPAAAADSEFNVIGHGGIASHDLLTWTSKCGEPNMSSAQTPSKLVRSGGTLGGSALGWDFTRTGNEAGLLAYRADNTAISQVSVDVLGMSRTIDGHAVALFDYWDGFNLGYYVGIGDKFTFNLGGSWTTLEHTNFNWYRVDSNFDRVAGTEKVSTIAAMRDYQGLASGVYTGFVLGCNAHAFYLDDLTLSLGANTVSYDLETPKITSMAHVEYSLDGRTVRNGNLTVNVGKGIRVLGHAHGHGDGIYFSGSGALWAQPYGKAWRRVATGSFDPDFYASFAQRPQHRTRYYFTTAGSSVHTADSSEQMVVNVRADISVKLLDRRIREGQSIVMEGRLRPGNRGQKLKLQRRVGGAWKTIASGQTGRRGVFRLSKVASSPGTWTVRVLVEAGNGNLGTKSRRVDVTVTKAPPPPEPDPIVVVDPPPPPEPTPVPPAPDPVRRATLSVQSTGAARAIIAPVGQAPPSP